ncbi:MAG TPA: hypothetical protein DCM87_10705 [Planctomycetes bacterium]|nr:hypothetical protein [Planctomycetota bacterium]
MHYAPETDERAVALVLSGVKREKILREIGCTGESLRLRLKKAKEKLAAHASPDAPADGDAGKAIEEAAVAPIATPSAVTARARHACRDSERTQACAPR